MHSKRSIGWWLAMVGLIGAVGLPVDAAAQNRDDVREARKLFKDAQRAGVEGKYKVAAGLYTKAYELDPSEPTHLYNAGVAYQQAFLKSRRIDDAQVAISTFEKFLASESDGSDGRPSVRLEEFEKLDAQNSIATLKDAIDDRTKTQGAMESTEQELDDARGRISSLEEELQQAAKAQASAEAKAGELDSVRADRDLWQQRALAGGSGRGSGKRHLGAALMAAGGVAVGMGILYGLDAKRIGDHLNQDEPWGPLHDDLVSDGETADRNMIIFTSVGSAVLIGGGVLYYLGVRESHAFEIGERAAVRPVVSDDAALVQVEGRF
ncbi:hypothetical protein [Haliangium sp.]|uniref:hypothetical protein n=1 Tax=Haliangium sp. TaxID=2663208 RepID=UPI003D097E87